MQQINNITNEANQKFTILFDDTSEKIIIELIYRPTQLGWFMDVSYNDFAVKGIRVCVAPNALRQFKNVIPFGISIYTEDGQEPLFIDDFITGRANIGILNKEEVEIVETEIYG